MKSVRVSALVLGALAVTLVGCGPRPAAAAPATVASPAQPSSPQQSATQGLPAPAAAGPAMVDVSKNDALGSYLVDDKGMSLYLYTKDSPGTSNCYDKCATAWPPLLTSGSAVAGTSLDSSKLGVTTRSDGKTQVTYNGWPLYYFAKDKQPGDTTGQGVGSVWYLISPGGDAIK